MLTRSTVVVALGALVLAWPIAEVAARLLRLAPEIRVIDVTHVDTVYERSDNPILGFEMKANWRDENADFLRSYPFTNSHGQRDVERSFEKPPGVDRVLLLGASIVEGVGIRELDRTISRQLEAMLSGTTEVLNFGVSAYCTRAKVELLRVKGLAFDPDVVVLFVSRNDFNNFNFEAFELSVAAERPAVVEGLFKHSHVFRALAVRTNLFGYRVQNDPIAWNQSAIGDNNVVDGFAAFAALAREHGFRPLVAIWPRFTDDAVQDTDPMPERVGRLLFEEIARVNGLPSFRFSKYFEGELKRNPDANPRLRYTIGDRLHPNPFGASIAAAALSEEVRVVRLQPPPGAAAADPDVVAAARRRSEIDHTQSRRLVNVANTLYGQGRSEEAIAKYREAIAEQAGLAEAHHNLGVALQAIGRTEEALVELRTALRLSPDVAQLHYGLGSALVQQGRVQESLPHIRRALDLQPDLPGGMRALEAAEAAATAAAERP